MATELNIENREVRIKDPAASGALFSGNWLYFNTTNVSYNYRNILVYKPITKVDTNITGAEVAIGDEANYKRRKGIISYGGMNALTISVDAIYDLNSCGSVTNDVQLITPGRIRQMFTVPKTYRLYDNKLGSALMYDSNSDVKNPYSTNSGIPVTIQDLNFSKSSDSLNKISFSITFMEDKQE